MMTIYIIIFIILFIIFFEIWGRRPQVHKKILQSDLKYYLKNLLFRGYDGGHLIIRISADKKTKRFIQFVKYIGGRNQVGLQFSYPLAEWSKPYYNNLKLILKKNKIKFDIEKTDQIGVPEFIDVDCKQDLEKAFNISILVFQDLYGLSKSDLVELYFVNISPNNEKIGF